MRTFLLSTVLLTLLASCGEADSVGTLDSYLSARGLAVIGSERRPLTERERRIAHVQLVGGAVCLLVCFFIGIRISRKERRAKGQPGEARHVEEGNQKEQGSDTGGESSSEEHRE